MRQSFTEVLPTRRALVLVAAALIMAAFPAAAVLAQGNASPSKSDTQESESVKPPDKETPRELIYPYYCLRKGWESRLELMDRAPRAIEFTMAVHGLSGRTVTAKPMNITPEAGVDMDLREVLTGLGADLEGDFSEGSISILFKGEGNPLGGRLIVEGPNESWNLGPVWSEDEYGNSMIPPRLDTLWWDLGGSRDVELTVNNISSAPATADFFLDWAGKRHAAPVLRFGPHETRIISITETLAGMNVTPFQAPVGGLSILPRGKPALIAQGKITDADTGKIVALVFNLPQLQLMNALHAIAVPISVPTPGSLYAGLGNFTPHIVARNLIESEQTLTITVEYPGKDGPAMTTLDPIRLPGYTTRDIRLDNYYTLLPLPLPFCGLRIQYSGPPGSLQAEVRVVDENSGDAQQIPVVNEGNGFVASLASYWSYEEGRDDYVFFTNMADKSGRFGMRIEAGGVTYFPPVIHLRPHETKFINLRELVARQEPDVRGTVIPKDADHGRLFYNRMDNIPMYGRILEVQRPGAGK